MAVDITDVSGDFSLGGTAGDASGGLSLGGAGALGLGALGFGALLAEGKGSLPSQFGQLQAGVPNLQYQGARAFGQGQQFIGQGQEAISMAERGQLTPEQAAEIGQYKSGLENEARQQFYSMGLNPDLNTAFVSQQANIDAQVNAMAQKQIQATIQLGLGQIGAGTSLVGTSLSFESAANQALLQAGEAQLKLDTTYSSNLTSAFGAIGKLFGAVLA